MSFIKNQEAIRDYSYMELAIDFGERKTVEELFAFRNRLDDQLAAITKGNHCVQIRRVGIEWPEEELYEEE